MGKSQNAKPVKARIKVTRKLKPPPEPLGEILGIVNFVPPGIELPPLELREHLPGIVADLPKLEAWLKHDQPQTVDYYNPRYRYQLVRSWVNTLRAMARGEQVSHIPIIAIPDTEKNGIRLDNRLIEALQTLRLSRLRECLICKKLFWAKRADARQCGDPKCKSALSSKLQRNPELKEKYYQNRKVKKPTIAKSVKKTPQQLADEEWLAKNREPRKKKRADPARKRR